MFGCCALPVFLYTTLKWDFWQVGGYLASWIIIYGLIQAVAPRLTGKNKTPHAVRIQLVVFGCLLALVPAGIAISLTHDFSVVYVVTIGLLLFALLFAMNSALHSFQVSALLVLMAQADIGFYYMANAGGRLAGTVASGALYQVYGLDACLWVSALLIVFGSLTALSLHRKSRVLPRSLIATTWISFVESFHKVCGRMTSDPSKSINCYSHHVILSMLRRALRDKIL